MGVIVQTNTKEVNMARDIKDTPLLVGDDVIRFENAMYNIKPESKENIEKAKKSFDYLMSIYKDNEYLDKDIGDLLPKMFLM